MAFNSSVWYLLANTNFLWAVTGLVEYPCPVICSFPTGCLRNQRVQKIAFTKRLHTVISLSVSAHLTAVKYMTVGAGGSCCLHQREQNWLGARCLRCWENPGLSGKYPVFLPAGTSVKILSSQVIIQASYWRGQCGNCPGQGVAGAWGERLARIWKGHLGVGWLVLQLQATLCSVL